MTLTSSFMTEDEGSLFLQAEQSVLGAVFLENHAFEKLLHLEARDFTSSAHQLLFEIMKYLYDNDRPIDLVTIGGEFQRFNRSIQDIGGISYLSQLAESCPSASNVDHYAEMVKTRALKRRGRDIGQKIMNLANEPFDSVEEYFSAIERLASDIRPRESGKMRHFAETKERFIQSLTEEVEAIPTTLRKYDEWAKGIWRGWLYVIAARPSVGKTAKMLQMAAGVARQNNGMVMIYSQEMDEDKLKARICSNLARVSYTKIQRKELTDEEIKRIVEAHSLLERFPLHIQDTAGVTVDEIKATARQMKRKHKNVAAIFIDYLQIMKIEQKKNERRDQAIGYVTMTLKNLAREIGCCVVLLSQLSRESERAEEPKMSHLKESGSIEQDADVIEFLWEKENDSEVQGKIVEAIFAKGRDIGLKRFKYVFQGWYQRYADYEDEKKRLSEIRKEMQKQKQGGGES